MEKTALVILLLGLALVSYGPITDLFGNEEEVGVCSCKDIENFVADAEGKRKCVYKDSLGIPTIGIGFNLKRGDAKRLIESLGLNYQKVLNGAQCLTDPQITKLFNNDLQWAKSGAQQCVPSFSTHHSCIQRVLIDMTFNMGKTSLCSWPNFVKQLKSHDYNGAYNNMKSTKWCGQVKSRCTRNAGLVRDCH